MGLFSRKDSNEHTTFQEFITATKEATERARSGKATRDDLAQIEYARRNGNKFTDTTGYGVTDRRNNQILSEAAAVAEDLNEATYYANCSVCPGKCWGH